VVIAVDLAGVVARLDNDGLAPWPFLHRRYNRGRGDRRGLAETVDGLDSNGLER
jgi:hypothetical protein